MDEEKFSLESIDKTFVTFKVGAKVTGTVVSSTADGYIINIGGKKDAIVPFDDLKGQELAVGSEIEAVVTNTRNDNGAVELSKSKADDIRKSDELIGTLKVGDPVSLIILSANNGGLVSKLGAFSVFIPGSQVSIRRTDSRQYVNQQVTANVLEIDLANNKIVASMRSFEEKQKMDTEDRFWSAIFVNKIVKGKVNHFTDFGAFVEVDGKECLVHNKEVSYNQNEKAQDLLKIGEEYDFKVVSADRETGRVGLSLKALQENPMKERYAKYEVGQTVEGTVRKILPFGAIIELGEGVEGLLHVKEASFYYVKNVYEVAKVGQVLTLKVIDVDKDNLKISLSLKALQEEDAAKYMSIDTEKK